LEVHHSPPELAALSNSLVIKDFDRQAAAFFGKLSRQFPARKNSFDEILPSTDILDTGCAHYKAAQRRVEEIHRDGCGRLRVGCARGRQ
jgi:hypothetical protein